MVWGLADKREVTDAPSTPTAHRIPKTATRFIEVISFVSYLGKIVFVDTAKSIAQNSGAGLEIPELSRLIDSAQKLD
jgi:hypothetical protein